MTFKIPREGYYWCHCRDCFDIALSHTGLCSDCEEAGCEPGDGECQRPDAYGVEDDLTDPDDDLTSESRN